MSVDTVPAGTATLKFRYHMYGAHMQDFFIYWETSSAATQLWTKSGQQHNLTNSQWALATVDMSDHIGETGKIAIVARIGASSSFKGDAAFCDWDIERSYDDDFSLQDSTANWRINTGSENSNDPTDALDLSTTTTIADEQSVGSARFNLNYGTTPSSSTGPDEHYDDGNYSRYIYFEQSGANNTTVKCYIARRTNSVTI